MSAASFSGFRSRTIGRRCCCRRARLRGRRRGRPLGLPAQAIAITGRDERHHGSQPVHLVHSHPAPADATTGPSSLLFTAEQCAHHSACFRILARQTGRRDVLGRPQTAGALVLDELSRRVDHRRARVVAVEQILNARHVSPFASQIDRERTAVIVRDRVRPAGHAAGRRSGDTTGRPVASTPCREGALAPVRPTAGRRRTGRRFPDPGAGVERGGEERLVAPAVDRAAIDDAEDGLDLLVLELLMTNQGTARFTWFQSVSRSAFLPRLGG